MCQEPHKLPDGTLVACRVCWQCRENKISDWVGRCIAESKTSAATHSVTLTYGRDEFGNEDHLRAAVLTYSDVQGYLKLLRRNGYPCRYFVCGEYGSVKGRAHWHVILFWLDRVPPHKLDERFTDAKYWPHGFQHWEPVSAASIRYVCKYIQKDMGDDERQGHVSMSKKPPLGAKWFEYLAGMYVEAGLAPQDYTYKFPEVRDASGKLPRIFMLHEGSASADLFCLSYLDQWSRAGKGHVPNSELIERYLDRRARGWDTEIRNPFKRRVPIPFSRPPGGSAPKFSEKHNCYYSDTSYGRQWWSYNAEGDLIWHEKIGPSETLQQQAVRLDPTQYLKQSRGL